MGEWGADNARALAGLGAILVLAWLMGGRGRISVSLLLGALGLQFLVALGLFAAPIVREGLFAAAVAVDVLLAATQAGTTFVFGYLGGGEPPFVVTGPPGSTVSLAFQILPLVIVISALSAVLWRWRILEWVTRGFAVVFRRLLGLSGAASLAVAANIFMGMVEAPILVRPYLAKLSRSDLFVLMTTGLATVAGTVLVICATFMRDAIPDAAGHLIAASLMSAPAAIVLGRLIVPQKPDDGTDDDAAAHSQAPASNSTLEALTNGVGEGLKLYLNILAMLITFVALIALGNALLSLLPEFRGQAVSVERVFGWVFAPLMWLMGAPWAEAGTAGGVFGVKLVLNEIIAFQNLAALAAEGALSPRTTLILTYAVCGFANFGSLGIMIAGLTTLMPEARRAEILELAPKSLVAGALATVMTGCVIAILPGSVFGVA